MNFKSSFKSLVLAASILGLAAGCKTEKEHLVTIQTKYGDMKVVLYDETPQHKENFLKLAREGKYDQSNFHRVIKEFMVQGGEVNTEATGHEPVNYTIPAEIKDSFYHHKGALAAARMPDQMNPEKASSGSQFYIVDGRKFSNDELEKMEHNAVLYQIQTKLMEMLQLEQYQSLREEFIALQQSQDWEGLEKKILETRELVEKEYGSIKEVNFTESQRKAYSEIGGAPHLDGEYTVFGRVVEGLNVIDSIAAQPTIPGDRPKEPILMTMKVEEISKNKFQKQYGAKAKP